MSDRTVEINQTARDLFKQNKKHIRDAILDLNYDNSWERALRICQEPLVYLLPKSNKILFVGQPYDMDNKTKRIAKNCMNRRKLARFWEAHRALIFWLGSEAVVFTLMGFLITDYAQKNKEIKEKVSAYEKTLPGYLEQKQQVERFTDSLKHSKNR